MMSEFCQSCFASRTHFANPASHPSRPLSEHLLQHLANFAHRPLPDKGFLLFETGQMVGARGKSQPTEDPGLEVWL
jgi:hypothetical protein